MRRGRPLVTVRLTESERQQLDSWAHRSRSAPHLARRVRIIQACAAGRPSTAVAKRLHVSPTTVCKWRARFVRDRLDGLLDEPRPGTPAGSPTANRGRGGAHAKPPPGPSPGAPETWPRRAA